MILQALKRGQRYLAQNGLPATVARIVSYAFERFEAGRFTRKIANLPVAERFTLIYRENSWGSADSVSGTGSSLEYTAQLRQTLPQLFKTLNIKTVFDAPCGDFNWMASVVANTDINYIGADIVTDLIAANQQRYTSARVQFLVGDIRTLPFPQADLWFCRDCLFHLSYADTHAALVNFTKSNVPWLMTTTHKPSQLWLNQDIVTGDFRNINLFAAPYNLPINSAFRVDDFIEGHTPREMVVWSREQIIEALQNWSG